MKKQFTLSVSSPCSEQWDTFLPTKNGAFCPTCQTNVVDLSKMNERQFNEFFENQSNSFCGRLKANQLNDYRSRSSFRISPGWNLIRSGIIGLLLLLAGQHLSAMPLSDFKVNKANNSMAVNELSINQIEKTISGIVRDENNEPMVGVNIYKENSYTGTISDQDGKFQLTDDFETGDVIVFSFLGYEPVTYTVQESIPNFMEIALTEYHLLTGEVQMDVPYEQNDSKINQLWNKVKSIF